jgi:peptide-methionine (R)-S-oxide reductase
MQKLSVIIFLTATIMFPACSQENNGNKTASKTTFEVVKSDEEWKKQLSPKQYEVLREKGTERPYTGEYWDNHEAGTYYCAGCNQALFTSDSKYDSGCGWPSFFVPVSDTAISVSTDTSYGMIRDEIVCSRCGGHVGHVFPDGPKPTGLRYCTNSASLIFQKKSN